MKTLTLLSLTLLANAGSLAYADEPAGAAVVLPAPVACSYAFIGNYSDADYEAQLSEYVSTEMKKIACPASDGTSKPKYTLEFDFNVSKGGISLISSLTSVDAMHMREELSYSAKTKDRKKVVQALLGHVEPLIQQVEGHEGKRRPRASEDE